MDQSGEYEVNTGPRRTSCRARGASLLLAVTILVLGSTLDAHAQTDPCAPPVANPIACENSKTGNPSSEWDITGAGDPSIQGFATDISVNKGETVRFKIDTDATAYRIDIYRMGYYGGLGARKITTVLPSVALPQIQPSCLNEASTGLIDCGNWSQSASWIVPTSTTSGIYFAKLVRTNNGGASHIVFVVRDDAGQSAVLFQTSDTTWQAYNNYGGNSLYLGSPIGRAFKVSYNRPFSTRAVDNGQDWVFNAEYPMVRWLEANGYNVSYSTGVDTDRRGAQILNHRVFLSVGHDEYWSGAQRANVEAARNAGVHLGFFSGNEVFWKTRWETSIDGTNTPYRTLVSYKETHANAKIDPDPAWTGTWRDPRFSPPADGGRPENALTGTIFTVNAGTAAITVPEPEGKMRFWRNTSVATLTPGQTATLASETLGYEWDEDLDNLFRPPGQVRLSSTTVDVPSLLLDFGSTYGPGTATHSLTLYRHGSGAIVFGAGTIQWPWGLDGNHDRGPSTPDTRMRQATVNLLADMGVQPATLQPGLVAATASTDTVSPSSTITSPLPGSTVVAGSLVTIAGTATDTGGGVVGGVEVSVDGGATWHPATGRGTWSFTWTPSSLGAVTLKSRAADDSGNLETPAAGIPVIVGASGSCPCSIWSSATTPAVIEADPSPVELGVKFRSDVSGFITGLRFYKGAGNTGPHVGSLWTGTGTLLAQMTFTNETASGWQQANFASPVAISANTTYVASYHTTGYAVDSGYFASAGVNNLPLRALADGVDGSNGVYLYGAGGFPNQSFNSSNYWVDAVFNATVPPDTTPPSVQSVLPANGTSGVSSGANVTVTFSEAMNPATISGSTFELRDPANALVPATVSYDVATRTATLDPTGALTLGTTYTATVKGGAAGVKDPAGNALAGNVTASFTTVTCPCTIWSSATTPAVLSESDTNAVELGVKLRSNLNGFITGLRFYKGAGNTGPHVGSLWTSIGTLLAQVTFTNETASGWQQANFTPVPITANTTYIASYHTTVGGYSVDGSYFAVAGVDNAPLSALADGVNGPNGVFQYGPGGFPNSSFNASNYWVDAVFNTTVPPDTTPPTVQSVSPTNGAVGVSAATNATATFSEAMDPATISGSTFELRDPSNALVPATVTYDILTRTATLGPTGTLTLGTTYTATVKGGTAGVKDLAGNALAGNVTGSFTTVAPKICPCTIWSNATTPAVLSESDTNAAELGVKFRSDLNGFVIGLRFYKSPINTGLHVGNLWTSAGILLAQVTFTNETASGWQQANFASPVAITANTTYIASYHTTVGRYSVDESYFAGAGVDEPPLRALADGVNGPNGVYKSGPSGFPLSSFNASNYWVDVVFNPTATLPPDATPPTVRSVSPPNGTVGVSATTNVTATFSEEMDPATISGITFELRDSSNALVPAAISYDQARRKATLDPTGTLATSTPYTATIKGGATGAKDVAGNALSAGVTWSLTTAAPPPPPPGEGPGGPILVVAAAANPFTRYYAEILRAEGLNAFAVADVSTVSAATLTAYDVVILGEIPLTPAQVTMFGNWVAAGGNLIAMRPDKKLAGLLGLTDAASTLSNAYLLVNTSTAPGAGIVGETIQFHGTADHYGLSGATAVAMLYSSAIVPTSAPAVTLSNVGGLGGQAAAFTYDLARSIVYTRQGNPAWAGQERDGVTVIRSDDMFFGTATGDPQPDWIDLNKVAIPQADEQQRLLANLIIQMNRDRKPLPRFWYLPRGHKAVVLMSGDDHSNGGTAGRFGSYMASSPLNCLVENWECIRSSSYIYPSTPLSDAEGAFYTEHGFEVGLHVNTNCANWTPATLEPFYAAQLGDWAANYPSLPPPSTNRTHCIAWSDWSTQADVELAHGIRLDTNYYYYPGSWVADRPGFFTGSGMPMRFARLNGSFIDVYQAATQMTDESSQSYPFTVDTLLDRALGPEGYYGVFTANMHTDAPVIPQDDAMIASVLARNVPVVSGRQMLEWLDGRNGSSFGSLTWNGATLSFTVAIGQGANALQVMLPTSSAVGSLTSITLNGNPVAFTAQTIKGVQYATFPADVGTYQATYAGP